MPYTILGNRRPMDNWESEMMMSALYPFMWERLSRRVGVQHASRPSAEP